MISALIVAKIRPYSLYGSWSQLPVNNVVLTMNHSYSHSHPFPFCGTFHEYLKHVPLSHAHTCNATPSPSLLSLPPASLPDLSQLKKLETLAADHNSLTSLPDSLSQLKSLISLHLSHNKIPSFPPHLRHLTHLQFVDLSTNQIAEIPAENVDGLTLVELNLNNNSISVLPETLATCQRLKVTTVFLNPLETLF